MIDNAVTLFPQPLSPTIPSVSAWFTSNETSLTAVKVPSAVLNEVRRLRTWSNGVELELKVVALPMSVFEQFPYRTYAHKTTKYKLVDQLMIRSAGDYGSSLLTALETSDVFLRPIFAAEITEYANRSTIDRSVATNQDSYRNSRPAGTLDLKYQSSEMK